MISEDRYPLSPGETRHHDDGSRTGSAPKKAWQQLLTSHLAATVAAPAVILCLGQRLGSRVTEFCTLGMMLLSLQALVILCASVRFERLGSVHDIAQAIAVHTHFSTDDGEGGRQR